MKCLSHNDSVNSTTFLGGVIKTVDLKVIFYYCPTKKSILLPPPFSSFARDRQVGKLDFEQEQRYAQGRE